MIFFFSFWLVGGYLLALGSGKIEKKVEIS
jgi:hypothetical protein